MNVREATAVDISSMATVYVAAFKEVDPSEQWTTETAGELIHFFLRTQPDIAFVAELNGMVVGGICGLAKPWWDGYHLVQTEIFLMPSKQREGIGSALFSHFLKVAQLHYSATYLESITFKDLAFPSSWYTRLGFENKNEWKVIFGNVKLILERLDKKVAETY